MRCLPEKYCAFVNFKSKEAAGKAMNALQVSGFTALSCHGVSSCSQGTGREAYNPHDEQEPWFSRSSLVFFILSTWLGNMMSRPIKNFSCNTSYCYVGF